MLAMSVNRVVTTTITAASASAATGLLVNVRYIVVADTACYIAQGSAPTAVIGGASSQYIAPNVPYIVAGQGGAVIAVIGTAGKISITPANE